MFPNKLTYTNLPSPTYSSVTILPYQATPFPPFQLLLTLGTQVGRVALDRLLARLNNVHGELLWLHSPIKFP